MQATTHPPSPMHGAEYHDAHDSASRGATWLIAGATERLALCRAWNKRDRKSELDHLVTCPQLFKSCPESWGQSKLPTGEVSRSFGIHSTLLRTFLFTPWRGGALCLGLQATDMHAHAYISTAWSFNQHACVCISVDLRGFCARAGAIKPSVDGQTSYEHCAAKHQPIQKTDVQT